MKEYIMGHPCPECGGCNYYCADCTDPHVDALEAVADAARVYCSGDADNLANRVCLRIALDEMDKET